CERETAHLAELADLAEVRRAPLDFGPAQRLPNMPSARGARLARLVALYANEWRALAERPIEPNGYYLPAWELAVNASAPARTDVSALRASRQHEQECTPRH